MGKGMPIGLCCVFDDALSIQHDPPIRPVLNSIHAHVLPYCICAVDCNIEHGLGHAIKLNPIAHSTLVDHRVKVLVIAAFEYMFSGRLQQSVVSKQASELMRDAVREVVNSTYRIFRTGHLIDCHPQPELSGQSSVDSHNAIGGCVRIEHQSLNQTLNGAQRYRECTDFGDQHVSKNLSSFDALNFHFPMLLGCYFHRALCDSARSSRRDPGKKTHEEACDGSNRIPLDGTTTSGEAGERRLPQTTTETASANKSYAHMSSPWIRSWILPRDPTIHARDPWTAMPSARQMRSRFVATVGRASRGGLRK